MSLAEGGIQEWSQRGDYLKESCFLPRLSQKMAGGPGKTAERARYIQLTRQGLNNAEICRMLGIERKTGSKWRNGYRVRDPKTGKVRQYVPIVMVREETPISARFLSDLSLDIFSAPDRC
jgi:hypothetical protein